MLGIGRTLLYELLDAKRLKSVKIGARRLITVQSINELLASTEAAQ